MEQELKKRLRMINHLPRELVGLLLFSAFCSVSAIYTQFFGSEDLQASLATHLGWSGLHLYIFVLISLVVLLVTKDSKAINSIRFIFLVMLVVGIISLTQGLEFVNHANPYLRYGGFRIIWELILPSIFIYITFTKPVESFYVE